MISKLPSWVWPATWLLAFVAGMINVVGLLGFERQAVTHLSGITTMVGAAIAQGSGASLRHYLALLGSFIAGTIISALIIQDSTLRIGRRYGAALLLESVILVAAVPLLTAGHHLGMCLASCACGLQNAMATTYSGAVVRTTHVSGMLTDLGIALGHWLRGIPVDARRLRLCIIVTTAFLTGAAAGALGFQHLAYATLYIPASLTVLCALAYEVLIRRSRP